MAIDQKHIVKLHGKEFILFSGLLDVAHQDNLESVNTELLQVPDDSNGKTAIVKATVKTKKGTFSGIGDANPKNVSMASIAPHSIRMAETRAVARALRFATNIGMTSLEELGGDVEGDAPKQDNECTQGQVDLIRNLARNPLLTEDERIRIESQITEGISKRQASEYIERIKFKIDARRKTGTTNPTVEDSPQDESVMTDKQRGMLEGFTESNWLGIEEQEKLKAWLSKPISVQKASEAIKHYLALKDERNG